MKTKLVLPCPESFSSCSIAPTVFLFLKLINCQFSILSQEFFNLILSCLQLIRVEVNTRIRFLKKITSTFFEITITNHFQLRNVLVVIVENFCDHIQMKNSSTFINNSKGKNSPSQNQQELYKTHESKRPLLRWNPKTQICLADCFM